jgi:hypothetical protein
MISASAGGLAATVNGKLKVQIPPGALKQDTAITIRQIDPPASGAIGPAYEIGPTGTLFQRTVTLAFSFAGMPLGGADPTTLHVATFSGGKWVPVVSAVDLGNNIVTGQITHLSIWSLMVYTDAVVPPEPDASTGGDMDGGADAPSGQGGSTGQGGTAGVTAGTGGGGGKAGTGGASGNAGTGGGGQAGGAAGSGGVAGSGGAGTTGGAGAGGAGGGAGAAGAGGAAGGAGQGGAAGQDVDAATDLAGSDGDPDAPVN